MSKTCKKCGYVLSDDSDFCPNCNTDLNDVGGAALFTKITAETEAWRETEAERKAAEERERKLIRNKVLAYLMGVVLVAVAVFLIWFTSSTSQVVRAIGKDNFDKAVSIYTDKLKDSGSEYTTKRMNAALLKRAEDVCVAFDKGEVDGTEVERIFTQLRRFDLCGTELDLAYGNYEKIVQKLENLKNADDLYGSGRYFEAYEIYRSIQEGDIHFDSASEKAELCVDSYVQGIINEAEGLSTDSRYKPALELIYTASNNLKNYSYYSSALEDEFKALCTRYEANSLEIAEEFARQQNYSAAVAEIYACMTSRVGETNALYEAYHNYVILAGVKTSTAAIDTATEYYDLGEYASAFAELESAAKIVEDSENIEEALAGLEVKFAADMVAKAKDTLAGDRANIDAAKEVVTGAYAIRPLPEFTAYSEKLDSWRPVNLSSTVEFALERIGDVFRSTESFPACGGTTFGQGWMWGVNGAEIAFNIGGKYDRFTGSFAVQRDEEKAADAYFEVWCDGVLKYTSEMLINGNYTVDFDYDISGCSNLKIKFVCAYDASSGTGGYCYHGICSPKIMKNMG